MIYISTSCLKKNKIKNILTEYSKLNLKNIELGSSHDYEPDIIDFIKNYKIKNKVKFTVHAYFPPPKKSFFVNIASQQDCILKRSISFLKQMIDFSREIDAEVCSFHSGFRFDPKNGAKYENNIIYNYEDAYHTFLNSLKIICNYAKMEGVSIAFEPNVLSKENLIENSNKLLLMCDINEIKRLYTDLEKNSINNLKMVLDLGHLKVTSNNLNFSYDKFIKNFLDKVIELHLHDNDGSLDEHLELKKDSSILKTLKKYNFRHSTIFTLESSNLSLNQIKEQYNLLLNNINSK